MNKYNLLYIERIRRIYFLIALILTALIAGCITIPSQEFVIYQNNFNNAKSLIQEIILGAKVAAEAVAQHPDNPNGLNVRQKNLNERNAALDARLAAVELIDEYNVALVSLASGADPSAVKGNLNNIVDGLGAFDTSAITNITATITPLVGVISQAVSIIDDLIKQEKFKEAVEKAQKPIVSIIKILIDDADSIHEIEAQLISLRQDVEFDRLTALKKRFLQLANIYKATKEVTKLVSEFNELTRSLKIQDELLVKDLQVEHTPGKKASVPKLAELETMHTLVEQMHDHVEKINAFTDQVLAHKTVIEEYKKVLRATSNAFLKLNTAVRTNQQAGTSKFLANMLTLRKAVMEYQEAKQQ